MICAMPRKIVTTVEMGKIIRARRNELGWSQGLLAEKVGLTSFQHVQRYETGETMLNVELAQRFADVLGLPVADFFAAGDSVTVAEPVESYFSSDEKTLLKSYRSITAIADKKLALNVVKRLAKK